MLCNNSELFSVLHAVFCLWLRLLYGVPLFQWLTNPFYTQVSQQVGCCARFRSFSVSCTHCFACG
jgi:hypothetical protein